MAYTVRFKLSAAELKLVRKFESQIGRPLDEIAKRALFFTMVESHRKAMELLNKQQGEGNGILQGNTTSTDTDTSSELRADNNPGQGTGGARQESGEAGEGAGESGTGVS